MSTPSNRTRIRSAINLVTRDANRHGAAAYAVEEAIRVTSPEFIVREASKGLLGASDAAKILGVNNATNIWKQKGLPEPFARINGGRRDPVWLAVTIYAFAEERAKRKAA